MAWAVIGVILGLVLLDALIHAVAVKLTLRYFEHKLPLNAENYPPDSEAETFSFTNSDNVTLQGCLFLPYGAPPRGLVLFCPEFGSDCWSAMSYASGLWEAGFAIMSFDFRNQGASDKQPGYDPLHWVTEFEVDDVLSAIRWIKGRPELCDLPLGLFGVSRGGGAALAAAARSPDVKAVVADGAFSAHLMTMHYTRRWAQLHLPMWFLKLVPMWHVEASAYLAQRISQVTRHCEYTSLERAIPLLAAKPLLLISGERDSYVSPEITEELHRRSGKGPEALWVIPAAKHNRGRQTAPEEYDQRLLDLFCPIAAERARRREPLEPTHRVKDSLR